MFLMIEFCHIFDCSALYFPPVEKRLSSPPRLTPLSTNNFVRCTFQNRIIKSLFSKVRRKNKNKKNNTSFKLHKTTNFSLQQQKNNNVCVRHSPSPTTFLLYRSLHKLSNYDDKNNQLKDVKKNNEKICDILNLLDE